MRGYSSITIDKVQIAGYLYARIDFLKVVCLSCSIVNLVCTV